MIKIWLSPILRFSQPGLSSRFSSDLRHRRLSGSSRNKVHVADREQPIVNIIYWENVLIIRLRYKLCCTAREYPMPHIIAVHGIGQQFGGSHTLFASWMPALRSGLQLAGTSLEDSQFRMAFYGDLFRPGGKAGSQSGTPSDLVDPWKEAFLELLWKEAAEINPEIQYPNETGKGRTPLFVQRALISLSHTTFFSQVAQKALIGDLRQVFSYMNDPDVREQIHSRVAACVESDTRVVIGHSLGSGCGI